MVEQPTADLVQADENFAANLRTYREALGISQDELARRMAERGFSFTQTTVWKIEAQKRPVKLGEAVALAQAVEARRWRDLTEDPRSAGHNAEVDQAMAACGDSYEQLKRVARQYLDAQALLAIEIRRAQDAGVGVLPYAGSWLEYPPEQAALEARVQAETEDGYREQIDATVAAIVAALRGQGIEAIFRPENVVSGGAEGK